MERTAVCAALSAGALIVAATAEAHTAGVSLGRYTWSGGELAVTIALSHSELASSLPRALRGDGSWTALFAEEFAVRRWLSERVAVRADAAPCVGGLSALRADGDGVAVDGVWRCPSETASLERVTIEVAFIAALAAGHRHIAEVDGTAAPFARVLTADHRVLSAAVVAAPSVHPWALPAAAAIVVTGLAASWAVRSAQRRR